MFLTKKKKSPTWSASHFSSIQSWINSSLWQEEACRKSREVCKGRAWRWLISLLLALHWLKPNRMDPLLNARVSGKWNPPMCPGNGRAWWTHRTVSATPLKHHFYIASLLVENLMDLKTWVRTNILTTLITQVSFLSTILNVFSIL